MDTQESRAEAAHAPEHVEAKPMAGSTVPMAVLAYIGPLVIISYALAKDEPFVKYHIKQGLTLFVAEIAMWFFGSMLFFLFPVVMLVNLAIFVLSIVGIVHAANHKEAPLPFIGSFARYFTF